MDNLKLKQLKDQLIKQTKSNMERMGDTLREYHGTDDGQYFKELEGDVSGKASLPVDHIFVWTPSFFTGMACLAYEATEDSAYLKWLNQFYEVYHKKVFDTPMDTMHDLGFMYSPYSVALYKLTGDLNMRRISLKAADELARRFYPKGNYIRAWGRVDEKIPAYVDEDLAGNHFFAESKGLAIVDCMMNIPLLYWAAEETGIPYYANIANAHADMTLKHFIREDDSVVHAFRFDEGTGEPAGITNYCGYSDDSYWARGTTWAIYGFITAYQHTKDERYLEVSIRLAKAYLKELDETMVPVWDFRLPEDKTDNAGRNAELNTDTSAAAVSACAFIELAKYDDETDWLRHADHIIESLMSEKYMNYDIECPGLLRGSNGVDQYWICGDYYFMEAVMKRLGETVGYW